MIEFDVSLDDVIVSPEAPIGIPATSPLEAERELKRLYGFLPAAVDVTVAERTAHIRVHHEPKKPADDTFKLYRRAVRHADSGNYSRAISVLLLVIREMPMLRDARRNLGMAQLESGQLVEAKQTLVEAVRLFPRDAWGYLLLANLYAKYECNYKLAQRFYEKALALSPNDPYALTSYGALALEQGNRDKARELFARAIDTGEMWPNAYYGLALLEAREGAVDIAKAVLDRLFDQRPSSDRRSTPVYEEARNLYLEVCRQTSVQRNTEFMGVAQDRARALECLTRTPVDIMPDRSLKGIQAVAQSAWRHQAAKHVVRYSPENGLYVPHVLLHELEHIAMEYEDREADRNLFFATTAKTRERSIRQIAGEIQKLERMGYGDEATAGVITDLVSGLANQLHSCPLDMLVEYRLYAGYPELRDCQLASLDVTNQNAMAAISSPGVKKLTPPFIYNTSAILNTAYALFIDSLFGGRTMMARNYPDQYMSAGRRLVDLWREAVQGYRPGADYELVDRFADALRMREWYQWLPDETQASRADGVTNPQLLKEKLPAAVMYLLDALRRFDQMGDTDVLAIASEIALVGRGGLDYASPEKKYHVSAFPGEGFSGLQMMCFMYAGFKRTSPTLDPGIDLQDAYSMALAMHSGGKEIQ